MLSKLQRATLVLSVAQTKQLWKLVLSRNIESNNKLPLAGQRTLVNKLDKENLLMIWPAPPAEKPAINMSLLC